MSVQANHISKKDDIYSPFRLTEEDEKQIREMAKVRCSDARTDTSILGSLL